MKTKMILLTLVTATGITAFVNADKTVQKTNVSAETYKVDTKISSMEWVGKKVTGQHHGTIMLANGELKIEKDVITGGTFEIDMNSIVDLDLEGEYNGKLIGHLKSEDFFSVAKYPKSKFEIVSVTPIKDAKEGTFNYNIKGKLTIKDITNEIVFPAMIKIKDGKLAGVGEVQVDRTKWNIKYGSTNFFADLGDKAIYNDFTLKFNIVAVK